MPPVHNSLLERITIDPDVRFGKPCIRGHRITVQEILEWLSSEASPERILADYPQLEPEDFLAYKLMPPNWPQALKPPRDEASLRREPFAKAGRAIARPFPGIGECASKWACT